MNQSNHKPDLNHLQEALTQNCPSWVQWLAQDADGCWWGFEVEPLQHHKGWYENEVGRSFKLKQGKPNSQWRTTLICYQTRT